MANSNTNTRLTSVNRRAADEFQYKAHAEDGIHLLIGTSAAPEGKYYGFLVTGITTTIDSITYNTGVEDTKVSGDTQFTGITLPQGAYFTIPGGFSTLTLSAGDMILLKYLDKQ